MLFVCRTIYEATGKFPKDYKSALTDDEIVALYKCSPIFHVEKVETPYLLLIGKKDLRVVPHFQGFIRRLQANGVPCKYVTFVLREVSIFWILRVLNYPDSNHPLEEVEVEADFAINMLSWFAEHS